MDILSQTIKEFKQEQFCAEMMERLNIQRMNDVFCDVTLEVSSGDGNIEPLIVTQLKAHRIVLAAASPFFYNALNSDMKERKEGVIRLNQTSKSVMEAVLQYLYTGHVDVTEDHVLDLIAIADYLLLLSLKTLSERFLQQKLAIENCVSTYFFAEKYRCEELMAKSLEFINSDFTAVMATEGFLSLDSKQVTELISSDDIIVNTEQEVFKAILNWVSQNRSEREGEFAGLFRQIRLISVSHDYLFNEMVKEELVTQNIECLKVVLDAMKWIANATEEDVPQPPRKCLETHTDAILACGGRKAFYYLPEVKRWYKLPGRLLGSVNFEDHSVAQYGDKVYIAGGETFAIYEYHLPLLKTCATPPDRPGEREFSSLTVLKGYLYASTIAVDPVAIVYKYDPNEGLWETLTDPPTRRLAACGVADGKHLYLMGGASVTTLLTVASTERFDPDENRWEEVAAMNQVRHGAFGAASNEKIYVAGGLHDGTTLASCEVYNPVANDWQFIASLQVPRWSGSMLCFKGALYVLGGSKFESTELSVEVYDPDRNKWRKETHIPTSSQRGFKACVARISKDAINNLQPLEN